MFPGANAQVYRNEAGEPTGWDYPSDEPPEIDDMDDREEDPDYCPSCGIDWQYDYNENCKTCMEG